MNNNTFKLESVGKVGFAGDWHGNTYWALGKLNSFAEEGVTRVYHVGDFGLWPGHDSAAYLRKVNRDAEKYGIDVYVILGNHEDYTKFNKLKSTESGWRQYEAYKRVFFAERGIVWYDGDVRMAALGGAGSIDKNLRVEGKSWWPEEEVLDSDVDSLIKNVNDAGWDRVDILITHDVATGAFTNGFTHLPLWATPDVELYCNVQRNRLRIGNDAVRPHVVVHGHWHEYSNSIIDGVDKDLNGYTTEVVGLACDGMRCNTIVSDLEDFDGTLKFYITE